MTEEPSNYKKDKKAKSALGKGLISQIYIL